MKHVKCVVVGDEESDKTKLLIAYTTGSSPGEYVPTVFDNYKKTILFNDEEIDLQLWDTSGQNDYVKLRPLSYPQTDIFIVTFSLVSPMSLQNVEDIWVPEIREHCPNTPYILVGTKLNMRDTFSEHEEEYKKNGWKPVTTEEGLAMKEKVLAQEYMECDAFTDLEYLEKIFLDAIKLGVNGIDGEESDILKIGFYGKNKEAKTKIALKWILGDYHDGKIPADEELFYKVVEANNKLFRVTINVLNPTDYANMCALAFIFDAFNVESIDDIIKSFKRYKKNDKNTPIIVIANYDENIENKGNMVSEDQLNDLIGKFNNCMLFKLKSYEQDDIDDIFYYLSKKIAENIVIKKESKKKKTKIKTKTKPKTKIFRQKKSNKKYF